jgi:hypothetical protein
MNLPGRSLNPALSTPDRQVILIETVPCASGDCFAVTFESAESRWRQGIWFAVDGVLVVEDQSAGQVVLWRDTAPEQVRIEVRTTNDGLLRFYNAWDSGRGLGSESQSHTSGMLREADATDLRYRCSDINPEPTFEALVFKIGPVS